jgi:site-specific DNA recombinase
VSYDGIGCSAIAERLNADLEQYPPPTPPGGRRARGAWGKSSVYEILKNPKYTGYQVFNRRATRSGGGRVNDPMKWVWSAEPTHEPLIAKWMYDEIQARAPRRSARVEEANPPRQAARTYLLRGLTRCWCGRRMHGSQRRSRTRPHGYAYYQCWPRTNNRGRADRFHPKATYVREDAVLDAVARFYADRVFGPDRAAALTADLATLDDRAAAEHQAQRERLQRTIADPTRRQLRLNLVDAPAPLLRALFDATRLAIDMHEDSDDVTLTVTCPRATCQLLLRRPGSWPLPPGEVRTTSTNCRPAAELIVSARVPVRRVRRRR